MLLLAEKLSDVPIMSLQTGSELARTKSPIIDPRKLTIIALYIDGPGIEQQPSVLHVSDIREASSLGFIVDGSEKLMGLEGLVRLQEIIEFDFELIGLPVYDRHGSKLGKVSDYSFEPATYTIQQIYIKQSLFRRISTTSNIVHRKQIISVSKEKIIVEVPTIKDRLTKHAEKATNFVNPFRSTPQPDHEHSKLK